MHISMYRKALCLLPLCAPMALCQAGAPSADTIYRNGYVYTVDAKDSVHQALAVRDGRIIYVGNDAGAGALRGKHTKVVDLRGRMLMPGLIDGHMHPVAGGAQLLHCNLNYEALTVAQFQSRIQACLDRDGKDDASKLFTVVNWFQQNMLPAGTEVTYKDLDALKTKRPIMVQSSFGHSALANSRALELAGIKRDTPDPTAGKITRDAAGNATGILEDSAQQLVGKLVPPETAEDRVAAARAALDAMRKQGITNFLDAVAGEESITAFATLQRQGELTARAHFAVLLTPEDASADAVKAVAAVRALALRYDQGKPAPAPALNVGAAKLFMDGVIAAPALTGVMLQPYNVNQGTAAHPHWVPGTSKGPGIYFQPEVFNTVLLELTKAGLDAHVHVDGDGAVREALNGIAYLRSTEAGKKARPALAHNEIVDASDFPRYAALDVSVVQSFQWEKPAPDTLGGLQGYLEPARYDTIEPAAPFQQAGVRIAYGSDWPVDPLDEWFALKVGMTRTNAPEAGPQFAGRLGRDAGLSAATVIRAITWNAAYTLRQEKETGSLEPGKLADLIVLDRNFFKIKPEDVAKTKVLLTVVGGKTVYRDPAFK